MLCAAVHFTNGAVCCVCIVVCVRAGESEEQYLATEALVRSIGFDRVNTAAYSPRPNTPAAEWDNQVRPGSWLAGLRL